MNTVLEIIFTFCGDNHIDENLKRHSGVHEGFEAIFSALA